MRSRKQNVVANLNSQQEEFHVIQEDHVVLVLLLDGKSTHSDTSAEDL